LEGRSKELSESKATLDFSGKTAKKPEKRLVFCEKVGVFCDFQRNELPQKMRINREAAISEWGGRLK